jgi:hypothetical protein
MFTSAKAHRQVVKTLQQMTQSIHTTRNRVLMRWQSQAIRTKVSSRGKNKLQVRVDHQLSLMAIHVFSNKENLEKMF